MNLNIKEVGGNNYPPFKSKTTPLLVHSIANSIHSVRVSVHAASFLARWLLSFALEIELEKRQKAIL